MRRFGVVAVTGGLGLMLVLAPPSGRGAGSDLPAQAPPPVSRSAVAAEVSRLAKEQGFLKTAEWVVRERLYQGDWYREVGRQWAGENPLTAAKWAVGLKLRDGSQGFPGADVDTYSREDAIAGVATGWAEKAPSAAARWASQLKGLHERNAAVTHACVAWAEKEPLAAAKWALKLPSTGDNWQVRIGGLSGVAGGWARKDPSAAVKWAATLKEDDERSQAFGAIGYEWAQKDAPAAVGWVKGLPPAANGKAYDAVVVGLVRTAVDRQSGFRTTVSLLDGMPAAARPSVLRTLVRYWMWERNDPSSETELAGWLMKEPSGPLRDELVQIWTPQREFGLAMQLAGQIENPRDRSRQIEETFGKWAATDRAAAQTWLKKSTLPEKTKTVLRRLLDVKK